MDRHENACLVHYAPWKSRRVIRSVLAAEPYPFVAREDFCQILSHDLEKIVGTKFPIFLMTDSKSIFDTLTKLSSVSEKRLMIDISAFRHSYNCGNVSNNGHVSSEFNIADALTKKT